MNKTVKNLFEQFCTIYNLKTSATTRSENPTQKDFYSNAFVKLDYVAVYGGYVIMIINASTSQRGFDGYSRKKSSEMIAYLQGLIMAKSEYFPKEIQN